MELIRNIFRARYILINLVIQDLKNKYRNSILGIGWSLLSPMGLVLIIGIVYSNIMGQSMRDFIPYLFSGLIPWMFITQCAEGGTMSFINAEGYIKQTQTPIAIFPIRVAAGAFIQLLISITAFFVIYLVILPEKFNINMLYVIPSLVIFLLLGIAISFISALINTYFRDYIHIQSLFLQAVFYATPIIFPAKLLANTNFSWLIYWNPVYYLIEVIRNPLVGEAMPNLQIWLIAIGCTFLVLIVGLILVSKIGRKITFRL